MKRYHVVHNKYVHIMMNNKQMTNETNVTVYKIRNIYFASLITFKKFTKFF